MDRILGLARTFQPVSYLNEEPFFNTAFDQGMLSNDMFALELAADGSFVPGERDNSFFVGPETYDIEADHR